MYQHSILKLKMVMATLTEVNQELLKMQLSDLNLGQSEDGSWTDADGNPVAEVPVKDIKKYEALMSITKTLSDTIARHNAADISILQAEVPVFDPDDKPVTEKTIRNWLNKMFPELKDTPLIQEREDRNSGKRFFYLDLPPATKLQTLEVINGDIHVTKSVEITSLRNTLKYDIGFAFDLDAAGKVKTLTLEDVVELKEGEPPIGVTIPSEKIEKYLSMKYWTNIRENVKSFIAAYDEQLVQRAQ